MKVLIMGLPGSGKTTLANKLANILNFTHLNADDIRKKYNDWDFSSDGRKRQAQRMHDLSNLHENVIADFVCPTDEYREIYNPDIIVFMNTISEGRFSDTNKVFVPPTDPHVIVDTFDADLWAFRIKKYIKTKTLEWCDTYDTIQFMGRWQPWHSSHRALFDEAFYKTGQVLIMVRNMKQEDNNPFDFNYVSTKINENLSDRYSLNHDYKIIQVPNITKIVWGRTVGYEFEQIFLTKEQENVSATKIRADMKNKGLL